VHLAVDGGRVALKLRPVVTAVDIALGDVHGLVMHVVGRAEIGDLGAAGSVDGVAVRAGDAFLHNITGKRRSCHDEIRLLARFEADGDARNLRGLALADDVTLGLPGLELRHDPRQAAALASALIFAPAVRGALARHFSPLVPVFVQLVQDVPCLAVALAVATARAGPGNDRVLAIVESGVDFENGARFMRLGHDACASWCCADSLVS